MSYIEMQCKDCGLTENAHFDSTRNFNDKKMVWCEHNFKPILEQGFVAVKVEDIQKAKDDFENHMYGDHFEIHRKRVIDFFDKYLLEENKNDK